MSRSPTAIERDLALAIQPSSNGRHLSLHRSHQHRSEFESEEEIPFFWLGDTAWELFHRLDKREAELFLRNRAAKGFNVVMIVLFAEHGGLDYPNRFGEWPFERDGATEEPVLSRPNLRYYDFVDWVIDLAASLGILVALVPTWGRYINGGYYNGPFLFTPETAYSFGLFIGERYPYHPFILGGDSNRYWNATFRDAAARGEDISQLALTDYGEITQAMARGLVDGEAMHKTKSPSYQTFITFHSAQVWLPQGPVSTGSAQFPHASWLTLDACQSGHYNAASRPAASSEQDGPAPAPAAGQEQEQGQTGAISSDPKTLPSLWRAVSSYDPIRQMYATPRPDGHPRPVIDLEAHYENTNHWFRKPYPLWNADNIRRGAWQALCAGACGYTYGVNSIWQMHNDQSETHPPIQPPTVAFTNWYLELDLPGAFMASTAKGIIQSLPDYFSRIPDQSFILSDTQERSVSGQAEQADQLAGEELVSGMRSSTGRWAMVHLPFGGRVEVDLGAALPVRTCWRAWWWDPRIGSRQVFDASDRSDKRRSKDKDGDDDVVRSKVFTAPDEQDWLLYLEAI